MGLKSVGESLVLEGHGLSRVPMSLRLPKGDEWQATISCPDKGSGAPSFALSAKGGISRSFGEGPRGKSSGIPPFANNTKDGARRIQNPSATKFV